MDEHIQKVDIDIICNGKPSELTPSSDLKTAYQITPISLMPDQRDTQAIQDWWREE